MRRRMRREQRNDSLFSATGAFGGAGRLKSGVGGRSGGRRSGGGGLGDSDGTAHEEQHRQLRRRGRKFRWALPLLRRARALVSLARGSDGVKKLEHEAACEGITLTMLLLRCVHDAALPVGVAQSREHVGWNIAEAALRPLLHDLVTCCLEGSQEQLLEANRAENASPVRCQSNLLNLELHGISNCSLLKCFDKCFQC